MRDVELDARDEPLGDPLARFEVELPLRSLPGPAARGLDVFEETGPVRPVAGDAGWGERVVRGRGVEVWLPFCGVGVEGSVLEFKDFDFALLGGGIEGYGTEVCEKGGRGARRGGDRNGEGVVEDSELSGGVEAGLCGGRFGHLLLFSQPGLHGWMAGDYKGVPAEEEDETPGNEVGDYEE